jgi:hypothetical protein
VRMGWELVLLMIMIIIPVQNYARKRFLTRSFGKN